MASSDKNHSARERRAIMVSTDTRRQSQTYSRELCISGRCMCFTHIRPTLSQPYSVSWRCEDRDEDPMCSSCNLPASQYIYTHALVATCQPCWFASMRAYVVKTRISCTSTHDCCTSSCSPRVSLRYFVMFVYQDATEAVA